MPIANPSPYPTGPLPFVLTFHYPPSSHPFPSTVSRPPPPPAAADVPSTLNSPSTSWCAPGSPANRPLWITTLATAIHTVISSYPVWTTLFPFLPLPSPRLPVFAWSPRGHHARVVSSLVIVVCDAGNLYYAAPSMRIALHARADSTRLHAGEIHKKERTRERTVLPVYKIFHEVPIKILQVYHTIINQVFQFSLQQIFHLTFIRENPILFYIE